MLSIHRSTAIRWVAACALALCVSLASGGASFAQGEFGATISPDRCASDPLTEEQLVDIVANVATPTAAAAPAPAATPLPDDDRNAIVAVIAESVACSNANDPMRALALFTDRYLQGRFGGEGNDDLGHLLVAITREPAPAQSEDMLALISIDDFTILDDGRVSAMVVTGNVEATYIDLLVLAKVDDRWLIDEATPTSVDHDATPTT